MWEGKWGSAGERRGGERSKSAVIIKGTERGGEKRKKEKNKRREKQKRTLSAKFICGTLTARWDGKFVYTGFHLTLTSIFSISWSHECHTLFPQSSRMPWCTHTLTAHSARYIYIYIHTYTHIYTHTHTHIYIYYICIYIYIYIYIYHGLLTRTRCAYIKTIQVWHARTSDSRCGARRCPIKTTLYLL